MDIHYFSVYIYLLNGNNFVSLSGQNDCVNCFGINLGFGHVNRISRSDYLIVSGLADNLYYIYGDHFILD